ncbi:MAG: tRNA-guanine transglycosylase [Promethearchaeota archaeon]|jgi:tRNA-guanine family transglycosylase
MKGCEFKYDKVEGFRTGEFKLNNSKKVQTPAFWLGYLLTGIRPWEHITKKENDFQVENILVNAYEIIQKKKEREEMEKKGLREHLNFKGNVLMDSGGFLFQKKQVMDIKPETISGLYEELKPDMAVVLDHPFSPKEDAKTNKKRWEKTLENTKIMIERNEREKTTLLMPVIHGYSEEELKVAFDDLVEICKPNLIGLGSMVPMLQWHKYSDVIRLVIHVRKAFPDTFLHVFGVGGTTSMHFLYSLGVDSIDSVAWRLKAAFGAIQLPGVGDRFVVSKNRKRGRVPLHENEEDIELLEACQCPICKDKDIKERLAALDNTKPKTFENRALHNAWTYRYENDEVQKAIKRGKPEEFTKRRLKRSTYRKIYENSRESSIASFF